MATDLGACTQAVARRLGGRDRTPARRSLIRSRSLQREGFMATADTVVIGGGIVGAAAAYELAKLGARPLLLEAERLAYGASGRNLGYVWVHTRRPGPELDLVMWTRRQLPQLAEELGGDFDLRCNGGIIYFFTDEQRAVMREFVERRQAAGVDVQLQIGRAHV